MSAPGVTHILAELQRPKRLLWLIDSLTVGGAENLIAPFMRKLDRTRFDPRLCCLATISGNKIQDELRLDGVQTFNIAARNLRDLGAFRRLLRYVREEQIDLIHAHLTYASIWGAAVSRLTGIPIVASVHVAPPVAGRKERALDRLMRLVLGRWSARVIAVSDDLRQRYVSGGGVSPEKFVTVHNGIDVGRFKGTDSSRRRLRDDLNLPADALLVVTVSVLRPGKGIDVLLQSIRAVEEQIPEAFSLIVGAGSKQAEWMQLGDRLGITSKVRWLGHRNDVAEILPGCDVFVLPSLDDAFPTVLLEAMAASLPVVASRVGGIPEIVTPRITGQLVTPGDPSALAEAIVEVLRGNGNMMGAAGESIVRQRFSTEAWLERLAGIYDEVALTRRPKP